MIHQVFTKTVLQLGLDVGSTTVKVVVVDEATRQVLWNRYTRHYSDVLKTVFELTAEAIDRYPERLFTVAVTGSAGIGVSQKLELPFVQEVVASAEAVAAFLPHTDVAIELGGEDAKITFFDGSIDQRMNETCAGGTGAFIDQIAVSLKTDASGVNQLAEHHKIIYPIAARCGVFTKSDVTMLLNDGAAKEDVAASVLQAVVDQTIGGLACGRKIRGNVAFLGGPLHFLPELRKRFTETLRLAPEQELQPENAHFYVALGAALQSANREPIAAEDLRRRICHVHRQGDFRETDRLSALFLSEDDYREFAARHNTLKAARAEISEAAGDLFFGIDSGSTTTKAVLIDNQSRILRSWYGSNQGDPVQTVLEILADAYEQIPPAAQIKRSCVTGYGEMILKAAIGIDSGEVETLAHYKAASHFVPDASFLLDIGGQDIKCIYIKQGYVDKIVLNEACSSGCGSFLETFAQSLGYDAATFAQEGLFAPHPIDLGTRCTVFMNSKVKQAQKENASVADISAGLAFSVAKNALYKVLKVSDPRELGEKIMVQGGTFNNAAVLRALEILIGRHVFRADISGVMGAFGAALIAKELAEAAEEKTLRSEIPQNNGSSNQTVSTLLSHGDLPSFTSSTVQRRCKQCSNKCLITVHTFSGNKKFVSGNKCEKGLGRRGGESRPNLFQYQYERLFQHYHPHEPQQAPLGEIGLPRALNMFENYPYWFTLFHQLGFRVVLSEPSASKMYNNGLESVPSQTLCFPAKLVHGHILNLIEKGVKRIFYPALPMERAEFKESVYSYNCPVVGSYPEVVRLNIDEIKENRIDLISPFLPIDDSAKQLRFLLPLLTDYGVTKRNLKQALHAAAEEQAAYKADICRTGEKILAQLNAEHVPGIVLAGRPYHLDPLIHHGIPELIASSGAAVLSGDSVAHLGEQLLFPLQVVDQWGYHARLYRAATLTACQPHLQMIQLTSFGCGLDAVTAEQVNEILTSVGKAHTLIKIDEGTQLGAVRIRVRSLLSTMMR
ncbi:MAG: acyl-CoA dehydratase activase-related protein [Planctomycetaceae bacterium]|jgi:predicted CoA-substrate-specific enzyme activase|nr:acyl-CoA dehydratase activase-related protein [Planctomycetaceae bacterium]